MAIVWSLITILSWGLWLLPLQIAGDADERLKTLFITLGNFVVATAVASAMGMSGLTTAIFLAAFAGGIVWAWSGVAAVIAIQRIGIAKAMGIWSPLNIVVSMLWGAVLFGEFQGITLSKVLLLVLALAVMIVGILLIIFSGSSKEAPEASQRISGQKLGLLCAILTGVGWGSYFIPIRLSEASLWVAAFPMSLGMMVGAAIPVLVALKKIRFAPKVTGTALISGVMWSAGNYGSLQMMALLGTGRGFAIAQACVVVNALAGIYWLKKPSPGSRAARLTLIGVLLASVAAAVIGISK